MANKQIVEAEPPKSVLLDMADRYGMEPAAFEATVRTTCMPGQNVSREQFAAFLLVAKDYTLNPILKEIYAFPTRGGGIQPIVGVDGWANLINSHPQCDGIEFEDHLDDKGELVAITCRVYRKDRGRPTTATEYMVECKRGTKTWEQWPRRMLRHKALIQTARYAFGFSGIVDPDDWDRSPEKLSPPARPQKSDFTEELAPDVIDVEPEADPFTFTDRSGKADGEPLSAADFTARLIDAMNDCHVGGDLNAVMQHNEDSIDALPEPLKEDVAQSLDATNKRLRDEAEEKPGLEVEKSENDPDVDEVEDDRAPAPAHTILPMKDAKGRVKELDYQKAILAAVRQADGPEIVDAILLANKEHIDALPPMYANNILKVAAEERAKFG